MTKSETDARFDLYMVESFFDAETCREFINEMRRSPVGPATVYGRGQSGSVDERVRKAARLAPSTETVERVRRRLLECRGEVGEHFGVSLSVCEEPQFLRYRVGDFFVAHQDGNTGMLRSDREQSRRVSVVIFLNRQSEAPEAETYGGGSLVFSDWRAGPGRGEFRLSGEAGTLVTFRSETTHEVLPVTHGERYSIVSWYG
ncbi:MAG: 2OG-Fe(II) oxygenase [Acidobacteria bacterium]|nr:2OG-Fe(II) oxygenase [Acidobacteriota bacterium]